MGAEELQAAVHQTEPGLTLHDVRYRAGGHMAVLRLTEGVLPADIEAVPTFVVINDGTVADYHGDVAVAVEPTHDDEAQLAIEARETSAKHNVALLRAVVEEAGQAVGAHVLKVNPNLVKIDPETLEAIGFHEEPDHMFAMARR